MGPNLGGFGDRRESSAAAAEAGIEAGTEAGIEAEIEAVEVPASDLVIGSLGSWHSEVTPDDCHLAKTMHVEAAASTKRTLAYALTSAVMPIWRAWTCVVGPADSIPGRDWTWAHADRTQASRVVRTWTPNENAVRDDSLEYPWPCCRAAVHMPVAIAVVPWSGPQTETGTCSGYEQIVGHSDTAEHMSS